MTRKQEIALEVDQLKQQLRERERERDELWSGWFWLWILIPIVLIIIVIMKVSKGSRLDNEIRDLKEKIRELERESREYIANYNNKKICQSQKKIH